jgi:hypothetical protein
MSRPKSTKSRRWKDDDRLAELAELVLAVTPHKAAIARVAWEFAYSCRHVGVPDAINHWIANHNHRAANGWPGWPRLRPKQRACREVFELMWLSEFERRALVPDILEADMDRLKPRF